MRITWDDAFERLEDWRANRSQKELGTAVGKFFETEIRTSISRKVYRSWEKSDIDEAISTMLLKLITRTTPTGKDSPAAYFKTMVRNHFIDHYRIMKRECVEGSTEDVEVYSSYMPGPERVSIARERLAKVADALDHFNCSDRVALKLYHAPQLLNDTEINCLSERNQVTRDELIEDIISADLAKIAFIFDPDLDNNKTTQSARQERLRKRVQRASHKLRKALQEEG